MENNEKSFWIKSKNLQLLNRWGGEDKKKKMVKKVGHKNKT